ncbi:MAG: DUF3592 domain-containing protein [Anaerolineae bacterium]|nr:DUF3592 domain-containing protein [Anaerolineae bacterium]
MSDSSSLSDAQLNRLTRSVLNNPSASVRKEALLEIRKLDDDRVAALLRKVADEDKDAEVRDLAQNLLRRREIEDALKRGSFEPEPDPFPLPDSPAEAESFEPLEYRESPVPPTRGEPMTTRDRWTCRFCGTENSGGDRCESCGAHRAASEQAIETPRPQRPSVQRPVNPDEVFLLQRGNAAFLAGRRKSVSMIAGIGSGCMTLFMLPFVVIGIVVIIFAIGEWRNYSLLDSTGVIVRGQYTGRHYDEDDDDGSITYYASYTYRANDRQYSSDHSVSQDLYNRVEPGAGVDVLIAPSDPGVSRIAGTNDISTPIFLTVFSVLWNTISWGIFAGIIVSTLRDRDLARTGQVVRGELVSISDRRDSDGDYQLKAEYRFVPPDGGEPLSKTQRAQRNDLKGQTLPPKGTPVAVLYKDRKRFKML